MVVLESLRNTPEVQIRTYAERVMNLEQEKKAIGVDIKEVFDEARENGFDPAALKHLIRQMMMDTKKKEREAHKLQVAREDADAIQYDLF